MNRKASADQLAFVFEDEPSSPCQREVEQRDPLFDRLAAAGWTPFGSLRNTHALALPSRLFQFPIEFINDTSLPDEKRLLLRHPLLADLPFVAEVAEKVRVMPTWEPADEFGRDRGALPRWWHAVDLMTNDHFRGLLETRHLTDDKSIAEAVAFRVTGERKGAISTAIARKILAEIGAPEPDGQSRRLLRGVGISPAYIKEEKKRGYWAINIRADGAQAAWLAVHGIEDGWFVRGKGGYFEMSAFGLRQRGLETDKQPRSSARETETPREVRKTRRSR